LQVATLVAALAVLGTSRAGAQEATADTSGPTAQELKDKLEGMNEQVQTMQGDVDKLKRFKFSGYIQARWETGEVKADTVKVVGNPPVYTNANNERFYIRRGRFKLTYDSSPLSQGVI